MGQQAALSPSEERDVRKPRHKRGPFSFYNVLATKDAAPSTKDAVKREFGRRLADAMDARGWNQSELARRATEWLPKPAAGQKQGEVLGRDAISNYIRGEHLPRPTYLRALARALGCTVSELMPSGVPTISGAEPEWSVQSTEPGRMRLRINTEVSVKVGAEIIALLTKDKA